METPLGRQTLHCDNCYLITTGKRSHGSAFFFPFFFHTVSTLWESKYFSDYPLCALIHMVHSVCRHRCYTPGMFFCFFRIGRATLLWSSGSSAPCYTMNTQRSHTISHQGQRQTFIKLPSYLLFCHHTDMRVIFFIYVADFQGIMH